MRIGGSTIWRIVGRVLDARLQKLATAVGNLAVGQPVVPAGHGRGVPALW
jgi:hypothetical protein